ncbi:MAG TPA: hypothetical protein PLP51_00030 [Acholeplasmataceae bacterium]|nr:hypothetical protein [Acholeplasmataceae bacterium]HQC30107.1 hypothetical protein [Acholeplasmataceae bacterium]
MKRFLLLLLGLLFATSLVACKKEPLKLETPQNLKIVGDVASWDAVENASKYRLNLIDSSNREQKRLVEGTSVNLKTLHLNIDTYKIQVQAVGDNKYEDSDYSTGVVTYENKLPQLEMPKNLVLTEHILSWDAVDNAVSYKLTLTNSQNETQELTASEASLNLKPLKLAAETYTIKVQAIANHEEYRDSDISTTSVTYTVEPEPIVTLLAGSLIKEDSEYIKWQGRTSFDSTKQVNIMYHSASAFEVKFTGTEVTVELYATKYNNVKTQPYYVAMIDDDYDNRVRVALTKEYTTVTFNVPEKPEGEYTTLSIYKSTESTDSHMGLKQVTTNGRFIREVVYKERLIEFIAASSSTGYGNLSKDPKSTINSDAMQAFSYLTARALNADINIYSASGWGVKASRWTSPNTLNLFDAYKKVDFYSNEVWDTSKITPDVIVINLGTNDWSYISAASTQDERNARMQAFKDQYVAFLQYLNDTYPGVKIIMFYGLMLEYNIYEATLDIYNTAKQSIPSLAIIQVAGDAGGSNSHPSLQSHRNVAEALIAKIKEEMGWE